MDKIDKRIDEHQHTTRFLVYDGRAGVWVAHSFLFNVWSQGESKKEARAALTGAVWLRALKIVAGNHKTRKE